MRRDRSKDEKGFRDKMKLQIEGVKGKVKRENEYRYYSLIHFGKQVKKTSS